MTKDKFLKKVLAEVANIKANATKKEIANLNANLLDPMTRTMCIYGLMTGDCTSDRAIELTPKIYSDVGLPNTTFTEKQRKGCFTKPQSLLYSFTPLEIYITMKGAKTNEIIQFIKGKINTLKL